MKIVAAFVSSALLAAPAFAQEIVLGLGYSDFSSSSAVDAEVFDLEYKAAPFGQRGKLRYGFAASASVNAESDVFIGAGLYAQYQFADRWFVEGSLMPGLYSEGNDLNDLGNTLEFRSLLGLGYDVSDSAAVSIAVTHKSNASIGDTNPGVNTLLLRYHHRF